MLMLAPLAPHLAEELWEILGEKGTTITYAQWPSYDIALTVDEETEIVVQVNGKIIERISIPTSMEQDAMQELAFDLDKVKELTIGKTVVKVIAVKGKLVNIVVK